MTEEQPLVELERSGGMEPPDDELLRVWDDGRFEARRTVGGARIGSFAGRLDDALVEPLRSAAAEVRGAGDIARPLPPGSAVDSIRAGGHRATIGTNDLPEGPWAAIVERARASLEGPILESPVAALGLVASAASGRLEHLGAEPLEVDRATIALRLVRLDGEGAVLARWQTAGEAPQVEDTPRQRPQEDWQPAGPGWHEELRWDHGLELAPGDWLQVWLTLRVRHAGLRRQARLFAAIGPST